MRGDPPIADAYAAALEGYLAKGGEAGLKHAYEIGRRAMRQGMGLLDLIGLHHEILGTLLRRPNLDARRPVILAAGAFLAECLSSYEMAHRGFREAVSALRRLNELLEEEARRIAHALHDDAGQLLASVHIAVAGVARDLPPEARQRLRQVHGLLQEIEESLRGLSHELRPTILDDLGLLPALEFLAKGVTARSGIPISVQGARDRRLSPRVETTLYRVVQEGLHNAARHSGASHVHVRFAVDRDAVHCSVRDNGRGFDLAAAHSQKGERGLGLLGMRERLNALGGELRIDSTPGCGTELKITVPLEILHAHSSPAG